MTGTCRTEAKIETKKLYIYDRINSLDDILRCVEAHLFNYS